MTNLPINPKAEIFRWGPVPARLLYMSEFIDVCFDIFKLKFPGFVWTPALCLFKERRMVWLHEKIPFYKDGARVFKELMLPKDSWDKIHKDYLANLEKLREVRKNIDKTDLNNISDDELIELWNKLYEANIDFWWPTIPPELGNYGSEDVLRDELKKYVGPEDMPSVMEALTAPEKPSFYQEEEIALKNSKDIQAHQQRYFWILNGYPGTQILPVEFFEKRKKEIPNDVESEIKNKLEKARFTKEDMKKRFNIPDEVMRIAKTISKNVEWQDERKSHVIEGLYYVTLLTNEFQSRTEYPFDLLLNCWYYEIPEILQGKDLREELESRNEFSGVFAKENSEILTKEKCKQYWNLYAEEKVEGNISEFKGTIASKGPITKGKVRIVLDPHKCDDFKEGDILVAPMTSPEYVFAMKKSKAILTDTGGLTSHAAIVSRELGVPCLVNTKIATKALKDGDLVEVDADKGIVKIIRRS